MITSDFEIGGDENSILRNYTSHAHAHAHAHAHVHAHAHAMHHSNPLHLTLSSMSISNCGLSLFHYVIALFVWM
jgi:hypothetical protein